MKKTVLLPLLMIATIFNFSCSENNQRPKDKTAAEILGNPNYLALSYGGYRTISRDTVPTVEELKEDLAILAALGVKMIRTYNTQQYAHALNLLKAIREIKNEDPNFEMYVMLGAWIDCAAAWTKIPNHNAESIQNNTAEIEAAVSMANEFPDIVKVIAVGNEAMVHWAVSYYVKPDVILKWVNHLQNLKKDGKLPADLWVTTSDNYESWGGGSSAYHNDDLAALIESVDFISLHTYPFHDSHYHPTFWGVPANESDLTTEQQIEKAMLRTTNYAKSQYQGVVQYMKSLGVKKPIHIGETGWASVANVHYGTEGSHAADEYKQKLYYDQMRKWTAEEGMSCFYFEAFDEQWKDAANPLGSENHFGLINLKGEAKYVLWNKVDAGAFDGLTRGGKTISKTYNGDESALRKDVLAPPLTSQMDIIEIETINQKRNLGEVVDENNYVILNEKMISEGTNSASYPSSKLKLNGWEGTSGIKLLEDGVVEITTGLGDWWGAGIEIQGGGKGENLSEFSNGKLNFELKGHTGSTFELGFQTGTFPNGTQTNNFANFGKGEAYSFSEDWKPFSLKISDLNKGANLKDVTGLVILRSLDEDAYDGKKVYLKNIYYSKN